jgi:hypothetical protein
MRPCKLCGLDLDLVGRSHRCIPRVANVVPVVVDVANSVANTSGIYRYRDVGKRHAYLRDFMRRSGPAEPRKIAAKVASPLFPV